MFWMLEHDPESIALVDAASGRTVSYGELNAACDQIAESLPLDKSLVTVALDRSIGAVTAYLAALRGGHTVMVTDPGLHEDRAAHLQACYQPDLTWRCDRGYVRWAGQGTALHPDLTLLLSTSGSTGDPKFVRLSARALATNAESIAHTLDIGADDVALTVLPPSYAFGLSVVNSHLHAGAALVLSDAPVTSRPFWQVCRDHRCTSLSGVPATYEVIARLGFDSADLPDLRTMAQAGGPLRRELIERFATTARAAGRDFWVMYGQTEATARMSYVPPSRLLDKVGSIGIAIPRGELRVENDQLVYAGPNVMMGYALGRDDLAAGDLLGGELRTGDLGHQDVDGFFWIDGRVSRFTKVHGLRVNLDWLDQSLREALRLPVASVDVDGRIFVFIERATAEVTASAARFLLQQMGLKRRDVAVASVDAFPMTPSGKVALAELIVVAGTHP
jgi:acyl-CoA synthetase (AMP-forming)/AMP-acid ligase II